MEIYVHPTCTSCKKAEALLAETNVRIVRRDFFKERFTKAELNDVLERAGMTPKDALSKRANAYKELELEGKSLTDREILTLMIEHPTLIKRPLIIGTGGSTTGFNAGKIEALVAKER
jgi:Spx/MgsR family transcriptional regulator